MKVSLIVPIYNERDNIPDLHAAICGALQKFKHEFEIVLIDDGSTDGSQAALALLAERDPRVKVVTFRRNYGQTAAMQAGIDFATGDVFVTLDGDLQNDPGDIPMLIEQIEQGYDLVHGWRKNRNDRLLNRKIPSWIANWLISRVTGFPIHDLGCSLKAIRREIACDLELYGEMHRFIPILAYWRGAKCVEVVTRHHARTKGKSKYGISRTIRVILDLLTVQFLLRYSASPMHFFGKLAFAIAGAGMVSGGATLAMKILNGTDITGNPLFLLTALLMVVAVQLCSLGLMSEVSVRIFFRTHGLRAYAVRQLLNFEADEHILNAPQIGRRAA